MMNLFRVFAVALAGCLCVSAASPAILAELTNSGTQKMVDTVFPGLVAQCQGLTVPGASGKSNGFDYSFKNIKLNSLSYSTAVVTFNNDSTTTVQLNGLAATVGMDWSYKLHDWPHTPNGKGSADAKCSNSVISMTFRATATTAGKIAIVVTSSQVKLNNFDITIHGSIFSWLYNILVDLVQNTIKNSLAKGINDAMVSLVTSTFNKALSSLSMTSKLNSLCYLDWTMVADSYVQFPYMVVPLRGEIFNTGNPQEAPLAHATLAPYLSPQMIQFVLDPFLINSAMNVYYQAGLLHGSVVDSQLPAAIPIRLNTTSFASMVPALYARYPDMLMKLTLTATSTPLMNVNPNTTTALGYSDVVVSVLANGTYIDVFTMSLNASVDFIVFINDTSFPGSSAVAFTCTGVTIEASLKDSSIGEFSVAPVVGFLNMVAKALVLPKINALTSSGFPLPALNGMTFFNMAILNGNGQWYINSDLTLTI